MSSLLPAFTALGRADAYALTHHQAPAGSGADAANTAFTRALGRGDYDEAAQIVITIEEAPASPLAAQMRALLNAARMNTAAVDAIVLREAAGTDTTGTAA